MALAPSRYTLFAVQAGGTNLKQMQSTRLTAGAQKLLAAGDGQVDPTFNTTNPQEPRFEFSGTSIAAMLNAIGFSGLAVSSGSVVDMFWQKRAQKGELVTPITAEHKKRTITNGLIVPRRLTVDHGGIATLDYEVGIIGDGVNEPIIQTDDVALVGTAGVTELFTVGPMTLNGTTYDEGGMSYGLDFGLGMVLSGGSGHNFPTFVSIATRTPTLTFRSLDAEIESQIGDGGALEQTGVNKVYLRKKDGVGNVADGTSEHISFLFNAGLNILTDGNAQHPRDAEFSGEFAPIFDGTNAIVVVNTATAIT